MATNEHLKRLLDPPQHRDEDRVLLKHIRDLAEHYHCPMRRELVEELRRFNDDLNYLMHIEMLNKMHEGPPPIVIGDTTYVYKGPKP